MKKLISFIITLFVAGASCVHAQDEVTNVIITETTVSVVNDELSDSIANVAGPVAPEYVETAFARHFAWGATIGSSIDMTGQDMTAIDIDAFFGYKGDYIRMAGVGAGIRMMVSNSSRNYPVYGMIRTSFTRKPSFLYMEVKGGISFTNLYTDVYQRNFIGGIAVGFTLAHSRTFSSNFSLGYEFMPLRDATIDGVTTRFTDLHYAAIRIGASF